MKLLIILFSFYILLLPAVPCSDTNEYKATAETAKAAKGNHKEHEEEACNPFCNCSCCGQTFTPILQLSRVVIGKQAVQKQQYFYKDISLLPDFLGTIWQPPRV